MSRRINAVLDGVQLSEIGPILIQEVHEPPADMEITYGARPGRSGQDVLSRRRRSLKVTIEAAIKELYDLSNRNNILQAVAGWANGSILELSNHPGQQLHVVCKNYPALGNVREYTQTISVELEADENPFWEEKLPTVVSGSGSSGTSQLYIPGTAPEIPVEATFTPSGALTSLTVTASCGGVTRSIALSGMSVASGTAVRLYYAAWDRLEIMAGTTSLLQYRSAASADDLLIPAGTATLTWSANVSGSMQFSARGRWL